MPKMPVKTKASKSLSQSLSGVADSSIPPALNLKYQVCENIGDGNFAQVRRCIDR